MRRLKRAFYDRETVTVARELLGKYLVRVYRGREYVGRIVEVEAYLGPHDKAAHTCRGLTPRTRIMFGPAGHAYIYLIYGMYCCMNVVTEAEGHGSAVLLRALEPVRNIRERTQGPGLLCRAMHIDRGLNGRDLLDRNFHISERQGNAPVRIATRPRIGVDYAGHWARRHLRFYDKDSSFVSKR